MHSIGRRSDFISPMSAIAEGYLTDNIALHLLLDVRAFYSLECISNMRYSKESQMFWATVQKLFKGKGITFLGCSGFSDLKSGKDVILFHPPYMYDPPPISTFNLF